MSELDDLRRRVAELQETVDALNDKDFFDVLAQAVITTLRQERDAANIRADAAEARADALGDSLNAEARAHDETLAKLADAEQALKGHRVLDETYALAAAEQERDQWRASAFAVEQEKRRERQRAEAAEQRVKELDMHAETRAQLRACDEANKELAELANRMLALLAAPPQATPEVEWVKLRWLDTDRPVRYVGRKGADGIRGQVGRVVIVAKPKRGAPLNCCVELEDGTRIIAPLGCWRNTEPRA